LTLLNLVMLDTYAISEVQNLVGLRAERVFLEYTMTRVRRRTMRKTDLNGSPYRRPGERFRGRPSAMLELRPSSFRFHRSCPRSERADVRDPSDVAVASVHEHRA
jgi:hypothetical protein